MSGLCSSNCFFLLDLTMKEGKPSVYFVKDSLQHHQPKKPCQAHAGHLYLYLKSNPHSSSSHNMPTRHNIAHSRHIVLLSGLFDLSDLSLTHSLSLSRSLSLSCPKLGNWDRDLVDADLPSSNSQRLFLVAVYRLTFAVCCSGGWIIIIAVVVDDYDDFDGDGDGDGHDDKKETERRQRVVRLLPDFCGTVRPQWTVGSKLAGPAKQIAIALCPPLFLPHGIFNRGPCCKTLNLEFL